MGHRKLTQFFTVHPFPIDDAAAELTMPSFNHLKLNTVQMLGTPFAPAARPVPQILSVFDGRNQVNPTGACRGQKVRRARIERCRDRAKGWLHNRYLEGDL